MDSLQSQIAHRMQPGRGREFVDRFPTSLPRAARGVAAMLRGQPPPRRRGDPRGPRPAISAPIVGGSGNPRVTYTSVPQAVQVTQSNPYYMDVAPGSNSKAGPGIMVTGRQLYCNVAVTSATNACLTSVAGGATVANTNYCYINPDYLNERLASIANWYEIYRFRRIVFEYEPAIGSDTVGQFCLALTRDADAISHFETMSYADAAQMSPSEIFQPSTVGKALMVSYRDDKEWFCEANMTTAADSRDTVQYTLVGWPASSAYTTATWGTIWVKYSIELYRPTPSQGISLPRFKLERRLVSDFLRALRLHGFDDLTTAREVTMQKSEKSGKLTITTTFFPNPKDEEDDNQEVGFFLLA